MASIVKKVVKKAAKKATKQVVKEHPNAALYSVLFLLVGALVGFFAYKAISKNDKYVLNGEKVITLDYSEDADKTFTYVEEGVTAISFGKDVSSTLVTTSTLDGENGVYVIPLDKEGEYIITYEVDSLKYGRTFIWTPTILTRTIKVVKGE